MELSRVKDYILNGDGIDFNYYGQREYVKPPLEDEFELYNYFLYVAVKYYNFDIKKSYKRKIYGEYIPDDFLKNCNSFLEAQVSINRLKEELSKHEYDNVVLGTETYLDAFERSLKNITRSSVGGGRKFYSDKLLNKKDDTDTRIYVPCDSEYCYRFAKSIIEKSIQKGLDFNFKIMNLEDGLNGADNIVLYLTAEQLGETINMINEIAKENPDITFGKPHMFGYEVNDYIAVAPEVDGNSFSGAVRKYIASNIEEYGRTESCAQNVYDGINSLLIRSGIVSNVNNAVIDTGQHK
ncbi:MAG: hypothetical protein IKQ35_00515 [Bacilli bacterium]|nr:hypothetical protein [Bacilli bacterium]